MHCSYFAYHAWAGRDIEHVLNNYTAMPNKVLHLYGLSELRKHIHLSVYTAVVSTHNPFHDGCHSFLGVSDTTSSKQALHTQG